jgi:hypothetical protein
MLLVVKNKQTQNFGDLQWHSYPVCQNTLSDFGDNYAGQT